MTTQVDAPVTANTNDFDSMGDAAFLKNLDGTKFTAVGGYLDSPYAFNPWSNAELQSVTGPTLLIWVAGRAGRSESKEIVQQIKKLGITKPVSIAMDMEGRKDNTYLERVYDRLHPLGHKVYVYGSADTVFTNIPLNGFWVADYAGIGPFMYNHSHVRMTQYASNADYDSSTVKRWILPYFWKAQ